MQSMTATPLPDFRAPPFWRDCVHYRQRPFDTCWTHRYSCSVQNFCVMQLLFDLLELPLRSVVKRCSQSHSGDDGSCGRRIREGSNMVTNPLVVCRQ